MKFYLPIAMLIFKAAAPNLNKQSILLPEHFDKHNHFNNEFGDKVISILEKRIAMPYREIFKEKMNQLRANAKTSEKDFAYTILFYLSRGLSDKEKETIIQYTTPIFNNNKIEQILALPDDFSPNNLSLIDQFFCGNNSEKEPTTVDKNYEIICENYDHQSSELMRLIPGLSTRKFDKHKEIIDDLIERNLCTISLNNVAAHAVHEGMPYFLAVLHDLIHFEIISYTMDPTIAIFEKVVNQFPSLSDNFQLDKQNLPQFSSPISVQSLYFSPQHESEEKPEDLHKTELDLKKEAIWKFIQEQNQLGIKSVALVRECLSMIRHEIKGSEFPLFELLHENESININWHEFLVFAEILTKSEKNDPISPDYSELIIKNALSSLIKTFQENQTRKLDLDHLLLLQSNNPFEELEKQKNSLLTQLSSEENVSQENIELFANDISIFAKINTESTTLIRTIGITPEYFCKYNRDIAYSINKWRMTYGEEKIIIPTSEFSYDNAVAFRMALENGFSEMIAKFTNLIKQKLLS